MVSKMVSKICLEMCLIHWYIVKVCEIRFKDYNFYCGVLKAEVSTISHNCS